jgi:hypothetical protein
MPVEVTRRRRTKAELVAEVVPAHSPLRHLLKIDPNWCDRDRFTVRLTMADPYKIASKPVVPDRPPSPPVRPVSPPFFFANEEGITLIVPNIVPGPEFVLPIPAPAAKQELPPVSAVPAAAAAPASPKPPPSLELDASRSKAESLSRSRYSPDTIIGASMTQQLYERSIRRSLLSLPVSESRSSAGAGSSVIEQLYSARSRSDPLQSSRSSMNLRPSAGALLRDQVNSHRSLQASPSVTSLAPVVHGPRARMSPLPVPILSPPLQPLQPGGRSSPGPPPSPVASVSLPSLRHR